MEFEWDEIKNQKNKEKHNIDFQEATSVFQDENRIDKVDNRNDYGERRIKTVGKAFDLMLAVIYTVRKTVIRIISARFASKKERDEYNQQSN